MKGRVEKEGREGRDEEGRDGGTIIQHYRLDSVLNIQ